ncbi:Fic family protein [Citricoccus nitrophenolicus]|uniref:Fic family protein n=1 Tax=Citricoccus nitrophenolicus TaxID=863575 RepID=A0ABV0IK85_9MICC
MPTQVAKEGSSSWAVGWEDVDWTAPVDRAMSRRQQLASRGPYRAAVPPFIAGLPVDVDPQTATEAAEASMELVRFDAEVSRTLGADNAEVSPLSAVLLRTESASSSQIEQITAGARALALATIGESTGPNAALVAANAGAMDRAIALSEDITARGIVEVQEVLMGGSSPGVTGAFREGPVWIGGRGSTPHTAAFVAPRPERVPELMEDLVAFTRRTDVSPFVQTAVAHAQFETIHPFSDGNGRTGRALAHAMLRHYGITRRVTVPVSAGLLANVETYYAALGTYREGDLGAIVREFAEAAFMACTRGRMLVGDLEQLLETWTARLRARSHAAVWRALPVVMSQPAVTVRFLAERTGVSEPAASHAVEQMVDAGILAPVGERRRNRVWIAGEVLDVLDDFAQSSGRRRRG